MKTHVVIITIFCSSVFQVCSQDANLVRENVTMKLDSAHFVVSGEYYFRNPMKPDNSSNIQDRAYFQWHKVNFKPSKDLIIWFHLKKQ